jgi:hypothetical protein
LWDLNIPTFEEYGEWTSVQAHAFALRLLARAGTATHSNYLRAFSIDSDILRAVGVRYVLTDAEALDKPSVLRGSVSDPSSPRTPPVRLFELSNPNLGTYSPTHFVKAMTADEIVQRIQENKHRLDQVAVVSDDISPTTTKARDVVMIIERDGLRIQAASDGAAYILRRLDQEAPGVAASILEGLDEMLTVNRLGLPVKLKRSLACTNSIENMMGTVRRVCRNVKRWRNAAMALRWTAAGMMEAAKGGGSGTGRSENRDGKQTEKDRLLRCSIGTSAKQTEKDRLLFHRNKRRPPSFT